jgi:hypothetical protein
LTLTDDNGTPGDPLDDFNPTYISGDDNTNGILDTNEIWSYQFATTAIFTGQYENIATGEGLAPNDSIITGVDTSHYVGIRTGIHLEKYTNNIDADTPTGPFIAVDSAVIWRYEVTNTGDSALTNIAVDDNQPGVTPVYVSGDTDGDNLLDVGETWIYADTGVAVAGQYTNIGVACGEALSGDSYCDQDSSNYFGFVPGISLEKFTNGIDADDPTGPYIAVDSTVIWRYEVTNNGDSALASVTVTDDQPGVVPEYVSGDTDGDDLLDAGETWIFADTGIAVAGQYANEGTACGTALSGEEYCATDSSHYFGFVPGIQLEKFTNNEDADTPTGPFIAVDSAVIWRYEVTNTGDSALANISVGDNRPGVTPVYVSGDTDGDNLLDVGETWIYADTGIAVAGQYTNIGVACGEALSGDSYCDQDSSNYFGFVPGISLEKFTNGIDADDPTGPYIAVDSIVIWRYEVTNNGDSALSSITVTDDQPGVVPEYVSGDTDGNDLLDAGETWIFADTGVAVVGQYANQGTACGTALSGDEYCATDSSHYFGFVPGINLEKFTNNQNADTPTGPYIAVDSAVIWRYEVTNTGDSALASITVTDDQPGVNPVYVSGDTNGDDLLDVGETWIFADTGVAVAGQYANIGEACGVGLDGLTYCDTDPSHYFGFVGGIDIEKATNGFDADDPPGPFITVGTQVVWTYTITNPGDTSVLIASVTDNIPGVVPEYVSGDADGDGFLDSNEIWLYSDTGVAQEGQYANLGEVCVAAVNGETYCDSDPSHYFGGNPTVEVQKYTNTLDADVPTGPVIGVDSSVFWTYTVENTGNVDLELIFLVDDAGTPGAANNGDDFFPNPIEDGAGFNIGDVNQNDTIDIGEIWEFDFTGTATTTGQYENIATVETVDTTGATITDTDPSHYFGANPALQVEKATNNEDADSPTGPIIIVGDTVIWTYAVTNTGNMTFDTVLLTDSDPDVDPVYVDGDANGNGDLDVGETWNYEAGGNAEAGQYNNLATAEATDAIGQTVSDTDPSHYLGIVPGILVEKYTNGEDADDPTGPYVAVDSMVIWRYEVTNTGDSELANISVSDDQPGVVPEYVSGDTNGDDLLDVGETWIFADTGIAVAGQYTNVGTACGDALSGDEYCDIDSSNYFGFVPGINLEKFTNNQNADTPTGPYIAVDSAVVWRYEVTNTGDSALSSITVTDDQPGVNPVYVSGDTDGNDLLDVGETWIYADTGVAVAGQYANLGEACGVGLDELTYCDTDPSHYFGFTPGINIEKTTNGEDADAAPGPLVDVSSTVTWNYVITNTGDTSVTINDVTDNVPGVNPAYVSGDTDNDGELDTNEEWIFEASGIATEGQYENVGEVCVTAVNGDIYCDTDTSHYFGTDVSVEVQKYTNTFDADLPTGPVIGVDSSVFWTYTVENTGNVDLELIFLVDDAGTPGVANNGDDFFPNPIEDGAGFNIGDVNQNDTIDIGEVWEFDYTGTATTTGQYENIATVETVDTTGATVSDTDLSHYFGAKPALQVEKSTNGEDADTPTGPYITVGAEVTWAYAVTNTGNVNFDTVLLSDSDPGVNPAYLSGDANGNNNFDVGETWNFIATGTAQAGQYSNLATAEATDAIGQTVSDTDPSHYFGSDPAIMVEKTTNGEDADDPTGPFIAVGDPVYWNYTVTNEGNVPLSSVTVADDILNQNIPGPESGDDNGNSLLDLNETWFYSFTGTAIAGQYTNVGEATGNDPNSDPVSDIDSSNYFGYELDIDIEKYTNGVDADFPAQGPIIYVGDPVEWTYDVTNNSNVILSSVYVYDDILSPGSPFPDAPSGDNGNGIFEPGETWTWTRNSTAEPGQYKNVGSVFAIGPGETQVSDVDSSHYFGLFSGITLEKYTNSVDADDPTGPIIPVGGTVTWQYVLTNTGNAPLEAVVLTDDQLGTITSSPAGDDNSNGKLDVDEIWTFLETGIATLGQYSNLGEVTADDTTGNQQYDSDPSHYLTVQPAIEIVKLTNDLNVASAPGPAITVDSTVTWTYQVSNTGDSSLTNIDVTDDQGVTVTYQSGDTDGDNKLDPDETWIYSASGNATAGQYRNIAEVCGDGIDGVEYCSKDTSWYYGVEPSIEIVKLTNGLDVTEAPGPSITVDSTVTWTYEVTNNGDSTLSDIVVTDDQGVTVIYQSGDDNSNNLLDPGETWIYTASGTATEGQYQNVGEACGTGADGEEYCATDTSWYFGVIPEINIEKYTNGQDADTPTGPSVPLGSVVTWTYQVTNPDGVPLTVLSVIDDNGTPGDPGDDFNPAFTGGDTNGNNLLDPGETWNYQATGSAKIGQYGNIATVYGVSPDGGEYSDSDPSHYFGFGGTEYGDAPEGALAYPGTAVIGTFPTCLDPTVAGYVSHEVKETLYLGPSLDGETDGNSGICNPFMAPYNNDECFNDGDAGLIKPATYTISGSSIVPCNGTGGILGAVLDTAQWGQNIDLFVTNTTGETAYLNVLIDFNQDGEWKYVPDCPCDVDIVEHILVDFPIPTGYSGPVSALLPPEFYISVYAGYHWMRTTLSDEPVGNDWNGAGQFDAGETEDYLVRVQQRSEIPVSNWAIILGMALMIVFAASVYIRRFYS